MPADTLSIGPIPEPACVVNQGGAAERGSQDGDQEAGPDGVRYPHGLPCESTNRVGICLGNVHVVISVSVC